MTYDSSYYDAVLWALSDRLSESTRRFVTEEIDANELGLALEAMVEDLEEAQVRLTPDVVIELEDLERTMQMGIDVAGRLKPLVRDDTS
jgi:hypothetical protein